MKCILLLGIGLIAFPFNILPQCPSDGLKIQSANCGAPANLRANAVSCNSISLKWRGTKNQTYILTTAYNDNASNKIVEEVIHKVRCDNIGDGSIQISAREGTVVKWSLEAVCSIQGATLYSTKNNGPDVYVPFCKKSISVDKLNALHVYPNPTANHLLVTFDGKVTGNIDFRIFDITGKMVYNQPGDAAIKKTNQQYRMDLRNLIAGTYMLEVHNGIKVSKKKFVILKK